MNYTLCGSFFVIFFVFVFIDCNNYVASVDFLGSSSEHRAAVIEFTKTYVNGDKKGGAVDAETCIKCLDDVTAWLRIIHHSTEYAIPFTFR